MERVQAAVSASTPPLPLGGRVGGIYVPLLALALAAYLIIRSMAGDGASTPAPAVVDHQHSARLAENIAFFEDRVGDTNDSLSYNRLTQLYLQRQRETGDPADIARADASATTSLEVAPGAYAGSVNMAFVRLAQHDFEGALSIAEGAIARFPEPWEAHAARGDALMALGRYDEAAEDYRLLLERSPGAAAFSRNAAIAEVRGQVALAEQFWKAAIDADRDDTPEASAWARVQLANLYFATGNLDGARDQYRTALAIFPGYGAAEAGLGRVAAARGALDEAIERYTAATARLPLPEYVAALGDVLARDGRQAAAEQQYALVRAIAQLYESNGVRNDLTLILFEADHGSDPADVLARAQAAYEGRPSLAAADAYAWALYREGRLDEACATSDEALRLGTKDPLYLFHAAVIADAQGDVAAARDYLARLTDLNPRFSVQHDATVRDLQKRLATK